MIFVLFVVLQFTASLADSGSVYDTFVQCLSNTSNQSPDQISKIVFAQSNPSYTPVLRAYIRNSRFNTSSTPKPVIIVTPTNESHVQATVICCKSVGIQLNIRGGGHDYEGISYVSDVPFIMLDLSNLRTIDVNIQEQSAWVQAGATMGELYYSIWEKSKVHGYPGGVCPTVGVGGNLGGGGYGVMLRKFGLSVDNVIDAKIVNANGQILDSKSMGEDLFWAIRGGGPASFAVVLAYQIRLVQVPETVTVFRFERYLDENNMTDIVYKYQQVAPTTDDGLFMRLLVEPVSSKVTEGARTVRATINAMFLGNGDQLISVLNKDFPELGLKKADVQEKLWIGAVLWWGVNDTVTSPDVLLDRQPDNATFRRRKSDYLQTPIPITGLEWMWKKMVEVGEIGLTFNPYGGEMGRIPASATPFPHRAGNLFKMQYWVNWDEPGPEADRNYTTQIRQLHSLLTTFVSKNPRSAFLNYRDLDIGINHHGNNSHEEGRVYGLSYFNDNFDRLVKVKTAVDPDNFFRNLQSIPILPNKA